MHDECFLAADRMTVECPVGEAAPCGCIERCDDLYGLTDGKRSDRQADPDARAALDLVVHGGRVDVEAASGLDRPTEQQFAGVLPTRADVYGALVATKPGWSQNPSLLSGGGRACDVIRERSIPEVGPIRHPTNHGASPQWVGATLLGAAITTSAALVTTRTVPASRRTDCAPGFGARRRDALGNVARVDERSDLNGGLDINVVAGEQWRSA